MIINKIKPYTNTLIVAPNLFAKVSTFILSP